MSQIIKKTKNQLNTLYDQDFYEWIQTTVQNIRNQDLKSLHWENLVVELENLGNQQKHQLENRLIVLFKNLLKLNEEYDFDF
ncbi:DUF29 family protein [Anabaena sp. 90]|uniref:DUF29 family protein n=1 Tax=Anabaena sp. 90 TaxID=46234 RepID=UPI0006849B58|nr:DUF29 family protein [Anabaena sp. 90]